MTSRIIISVDDYGMTPGINQAVETLAGIGTITATNIMVNMPYIDEIVEMQHKFPNLSIGLHLNLTQGTPLSPPEKIPTLVDNTGQFLLLPELRKRIVQNKISATECATEIEAQLTKAQELLGQRLDHWNSHQGVHRFDPIYSQALKLLAPTSMKTMRTHRHIFIENGQAYKPYPQNITRFGLKRIGVELYYSWLSRRASQNFAQPNWLLAGIGKSTTDILSILCDARLPDETFEIPTHPAVTTDLLSNTSMLQSRIDEFHLLSSTDFANCIRTSHELINFQNL